MVTITDSYTFSVPITQHGIGTIILPVTYPASVEANTPFDITYTVKNTGTVSDTLYGQLKVGGNVVTGSYWTQVLAPNATVTKTFTHPGINTTTTFVLEVGRP